MWANGTKFDGASWSAFLCWAKGLVSVLHDYDSITLNLFETPFSFPLHNYHSSPRRNTSLSLLPLQPYLLITNLYDVGLY